VGLRLYRLRRKPGYTDADAGANNYPNASTGSDAYAGANADTNTDWRHRDN